MSNETENDPGYDPNTPEDSGYSNPNNADAVPSVAGYIDARRSTVNPNKAFNINDELTAWTSRLRLLSGQGLAAQRMTNPLMGFNHRMASSPVPINKEYGGLTFFTRPDCNFEFDNIANSRRFSNMAAQAKGSLDYSILAALDPDFELGFSDAPRNANGQRKNRLGTPFHPDIPFDNLQAFIPLLSTQLMSLSAPPDESVDVWTSQEGLMREQYGMVDSTNEVNNAYTVSATLNNPYGDPIMRMMSVWLEYMAGVKMGKFKPKIRNSIQRRMDYFSRIYGIRYDALGNISRFWTMCVGFPTNNNAGAMAQVDNSKPSLDDDTTVTINWQMFGARYNDPLYMETFNRSVAIFNPDMTPDPRQETFTPMGGNSLVPIPAELLPLFNYYGYPYLDSVRRRITWYVYQADYRTVLTKAGILR